MGGERIIVRVTMTTCSFTGCQRTVADGDRCRWHHNRFAGEPPEDIEELAELAIESVHGERAGLIRALEVGESLVFRVGTYADAASVRGSAYHVGRPLGRRYHAKRIRQDLVHIWRGS